MEMLVVGNGNGVGEILSNNYNNGVCVRGGFSFSNVMMSPLKMRVYFVAVVVVIVTVDYLNGFL